MAAVYRTWKDSICQTVSEGRRWPLETYVEPKHCKSCGRRFEWRKKWADDWAQVGYCSAACRRRKVKPFDRKLEAAILDLLAQRARSSSICPSEVARDECGPEWRKEMESVRRAGRRLALEGAIEVTQKGKVVDPSDAKGPIRYRLSRR